MWGKLAPGGAAASSSMRHKWYEKNGVQLTTAASFTLHWQIELTEKDSSIQKSTPTGGMATPTPTTATDFHNSNWACPGVVLDWLTPWAQHNEIRFCFPCPFRNFFFAISFLHFVFLQAVFLLYFLLVFSSKCKCHSSRIMQYKLLQLERIYSAEHGAAPGAGAAAAAASAGVDNPSSSTLRIRKEGTGLGMEYSLVSLCATRRRLVKSETTKELGQGIVHVNYSS